MAGLIPFNRRKNVLSNTGLDFYDMIDDFFNESWLPGRSLMHDTFKIDVKETEKEYLIEAEMPGAKKDEIELNLVENCLTISVNREETVNEEGESFIHRERRMSSMSRSIRLADANAEDIKAKLEDGVLKVSVAKKPKQGNAHKISIE